MEQSCKLIYVLIETIAYVPSRASSTTKWLPNFSHIYRLTNRHCLTIDSSAFFCIVWNNTRLSPSVHFPSKYITKKTMLKLTWIMPYHYAWHNHILCSYLLILGSVIKQPVLTLSYFCPFVIRVFIFYFFLYLCQCYTSISSCLCYLSVCPYGIYVFFNGK